MSENLSATANNKICITGRLVLATIIGTFCSCSLFYEFILNNIFLSFFPVPVPVCAITASGVPGGTLVSMNRFSILCG
jgi:hypothetical protein